MKHQDLSFFRRRGWIHSQLKNHHHPPPLRHSHHGSNCPVLPSTTSSTKVPWPRYVEPIFRWKRWKWSRTGWWFQPIQYQHLHIYLYIPKKIQGNHPVPGFWYIICQSQWILNHWLLVTSCQPRYTFLIHGPTIQGTHLGAHEPLNFDHETRS